MVCSFVQSGARFSWTICTSSFDHGPNVAPFWWAVVADYFQLVFPSKAWSIFNFQHCFMFRNPAVGTQLLKFSWFSSGIALGFDQDISYYIMTIFEMVGNQIFWAINISHRIFEGYYILPYYLRKGQEISGAVFLVLISSKKPTNLLNSPLLL